MDWKNHGVKIIRAGAMDRNTPQTPGMERAAAITHASTGASKLWAGTVVVQPHVRTGPHHHGELETVLYIVRGRPACAGAITWNSAKKRGRATSSTFRRLCRTRKSMLARTNLARR